MANAKASPKLQALPTSPSPAQTLPGDAVLDALKMIFLGAPLNEVLTTITRLIETHSKGMLCSISLVDEDGLHLRYGVAENTGQRLMECASALMSDRAAQPLTFGSRSSLLTSFLTRSG